MPKRTEKKCPHHNKPLRPIATDSSHSRCTHGERGAKHGSGKGRCLYTR